MGEFKDVLLIPQSSLIYTRNGSFIYAIHDEQAVPVPVTVVRKIDYRAIVSPRQYTPAKLNLPPGDAAAAAAEQRKAASLPSITLASGLEIIVEGANKVRPGGKVVATPFKPADLSVTTGLPRPPAADGT